MRVVLMGPPGAGKGTQAKLLAQQWSLPAISTGDIFRSHVADRTRLGVDAKRYIDAGEYVPDEITNGMVRHRVAQPDAELGFILDGYPRTLTQVAELDDMLTQRDQAVDVAVCLEVRTDVLTERLLRRAQVEGRTDDTETIIRRRLEVYAEETEPLVGVYRERGLLRSVDGMGDVTDVLDRVHLVLRGVEAATAGHVAEEAGRS